MNEELSEEDDFEAAVVEESKVTRRRKGTAREQLEGRISQAPGGSDFLARMRHLGLKEGYAE